MKRLSVNEVNEILLAEKKTAQLSKLDPHFMIQLGETISYLTQKRHEALREESGTAFDIYDDELKKIKKLRKQILDIREKKIMDMAWSARESTKTKLRRLLPGEKKLYLILVDILKHWRKSLRERKEFEPELLWEHGRVSQGEQLGRNVEGGGEDDEDWKDGTEPPQDQQSAEHESMAGESSGEFQHDEQGDDNAFAEPEKTPEEFHDSEAEFEQVPEEDDVGGEDGDEDSGPVAGTSLEDIQEEKDDVIEEDGEQDFERQKENGVVAEPSPKEGDDVIVIGIISDEIKPFVDGVGQEYYLTKGDVATVPKKEARFLIKNNLAKEIRGVI